jgi:hypothetical protein
MEPATGTERENRPHVQPSFCPTTTFFPSDATKSCYVSNSLSSKRKRGNDEFFAENVLLRLCRSKNWVEVIHRCQIYPYEAIPIPLGTDECQKKRVRDYQHNSEARDTLYYETALGIICSSNSIETMDLRKVVTELIKVCPTQVSCSQKISGHTPLRDAILNPKCTPEILKILLEADASMSGNSKFSRLIAFQKDSNGLYPIDQLILRIQSTDPTSQASNLLKMFVAIHPLQSTTRKEGSPSPLIRLLTVNNSVSIRTKSLTYIPGSYISVSDNRARLRRILDISRFLLDHDPELLYECSRVSGCSPLHVALRNFGNFLPLIKELCLRDASKRLISISNIFGDLPIHVASALSVPLETLQFVVERASMASIQQTNDGNSNIVWAKNSAGYTPVDLEWIRYIESGSGLSSARTTYPADLSGVGTYFYRPDDYYQNLLRKVVDQVIKSSDLLTSEGRKNKAVETFGVLIERVSLLISAASSSLALPNSKRKILHDACKLCSPCGPCLPLPLLELMLWIYGDEILIRDECGNLPIHYALQAKHQSDEKRNSRQIKEWKLFCLQLLEKAPLSSKTLDQKSRLPLHLLLANPITDGTSDFIEETSLHRQELLQKLFETFPESVERRDPVTKLDPFMLAAAKNSELPINAVLLLLRQCPNLCCNQNDS